MRFSVVFYLGIGAFRSIKCFPVEYQRSWTGGYTERKRGCLNSIKKVFSQRRKGNAKIVNNCLSIRYSLFLCGYFATKCEKYTFDTPSNYLNYSYVSITPEFSHKGSLYECRGLGNTRPIAGTAQLIGKPSSFSFQRTAVRDGQAVPSGRFI
jgi:hypothetical protein